MNSEMDWLFQEVNRELLLLGSEKDEDERALLLDNITGNISKLKRLCSGEENED